MLKLRDIFEDLADLEFIAESLWFSYASSISIRIYQNSFENWYEINIKCPYGAWLAHHEKAVVLLLSHLRLRGQNTSTDNSVTGKSFSVEAQNPTAPSSAASFESDFKNSLSASIQAGANLLWDPRRSTKKWNCNWSQNNGMLQRRKSLLILKLRLLSRLKKRWTRLVASFPSLCPQP